ncbi:MAG: hypothetical protein R3F50_18775 [Gammaproteobacteria bacterium]
MGKLYEELKRRRVFRVAAVYAVVAWVLIQVADTIAPLMNLPDSAPRLVLFLLIILFPVALFLAWAYEVTPDGIRADSGVQPQQRIDQSTDRKLIYAILILVLLVAGFQFADRFDFDTQASLAGAEVPRAFLPETASRSASVVRFKVPLGEEAQVYLGGIQDGVWGRPSNTSLALSPDGAMLVYAAWKPGATGNLESSLYTRRLDQERADPIPGTEGAMNPFFSPDGAWIGFFTGRSLRRVTVTGSDLQMIDPDTDIPEGRPRGASWGDNDTIIFAGNGGLYAVAANGGNSELVADIGNETGQFRRYAQPDMMPGSATVLFHRARSADPERAVIMAVNLNTGELTTVLTNGMNPRFIKTGHLLFMRQGSLMAAGFDPDTLEVQGQPIPVLEDVMHAVTMPNPGWYTGAAQFAFAETGDLVYAQGGNYPARPRDVLKIGLDGQAESLNLDRLETLTLRLSPGEDKLAFTAGIGAAKSVYIHDFKRGVTQRLETGGYSNHWPIWSPDGGSIAFSSDRDDTENGVANVYRMAADASGKIERLAASDTPQFMSSWSSTGVIAYLQGNAPSDIWVLPPEGEPSAFFVSEANEEYASFSPDGRWLAYTSDQTGRREVYVRPYPGPEPATLISSGGGSAPAWSKDGARLYYRSAGQMMAVDVAPGASFQASRAVTLIERFSYNSGGRVRAYDVYADGSFVANNILDAQEASTDAERPVSISPNRWQLRVAEAHVILNFFEELKTRMVN